MKKHLFILIFLIADIIGIAQTPTFNKSIIFCDSLDYEYASQVVEVSDGYLVAGNSVPSDSGFLDDRYSRFVILKLDFNGNLIRKITYGDSTRGFTCPRNNVIQKAGDGNFILILNSTPQTVYDHTIMMKINANGDSLWTRDISKPGVFSGFMFLNSFAMTRDHGFVIGGNGGWVGMVVRTDSAGNVLWSKLLGEGSIHSVMDFNSISATPDNGCVAGYYVYDAQGYTGAGVVVKLDSAGEFKWWREVGGQYYGEPCEVLVSTLRDSTFMVFTDHYLDYSKSYKQFEVVRLRPDGSVISDKSLGTGNHKIYMYGSAELEDSTWVVCGYQDEGKGWVYNVRADGDSLFYREIERGSKQTKDSTKRLDSDEFFAISPTTDGGLLMVGENAVNGWYPSAPWIVRTDRFGCLQPGCEPYSLYISIQPKSLNICPGDTAVFSAAVTGDHLPVQWQALQGTKWQNLADDSVYSGTVTDSFHIRNTVNMMGKYLFRCRVSNSKFTLFSQEVTLFVKEPVAILRNPSDTSAKLHSTAVFALSATGTRPFYYQWYRKDSLIVGATDSILVIEDVIAEDTAGIYYCKISNACKEETSSGASLSVNTDGIENQGADPTVKIFPNPASENVTIIYRVKPGSFLEIKLINIMGLEIQRLVSDKSENKLDTRYLPRGIYFLELHSGNEKIFTKIILN